MNKSILITGGAGFIGSALIRYIISNTENTVINVDKLTYAGNLDSLKSVETNINYIFEQVDICDSKKIRNVFNKYQPDLVMHLAAESHVDRSIDTPAEFMRTNIFGTYVLLEETKSYLANLDKNKKKKFRFHHISTDEVYGDLEQADKLFTETTPYAPSSPYSASKASSDHLVRAWQRTYKIPTIITNCSNNYGPYQFPEKLIPTIILNSIEGKKIPIYGTGKQIRDWLFVDDHARALFDVALNGNIGETYNIGGHNELENIEVVEIICSILDELSPSKFKNISKYDELITFIDDRPGHDKRYAIDASKIEKDLGWTPDENFSSGIKKTIEWYLQNIEWCKKAMKRNKKYNNVGDSK